MSLFALMSLVISLAAVASYLNYRYIRLPTTIGVMLVALVASLVLTIAGPYAGGFREHAAATMARIDFDQLVLHGMLAFLLFAGSIHVQLDDLAREWPTIALLAVLGTLVTTAIVGMVTWLVLGWLGLGIPLLQAMLFGALIAPTDPIAVLAVMKSVGAPRRLEVQMAGESLFNDGIGVAVFLALLGVSGMGGGQPAGVESIEASAIALLLLQEVGGAVLLGLAAGMLTYQMLKRVDSYQVEVLLTLALAMGGYALADALHLSAPIAIVVAGVFIGNRGRAVAMSAKTREHVDTFWELIDEILNVVLFLLIGLELLLMQLELAWVLAGVLVIPIVLLARGLSVAGLLAPMRAILRPPRGAIPVLTWGALHGGISVAMALSLPAGDSRSLLLTLTYCVVVFSILFQGLTFGWVIRRVTDAAPAVDTAGRLEAPFPFGTGSRPSH